jgi:tetratricopeptide (TPR) repeat protein
VPTSKTHYHDQNSRVNFDFETCKNCRDFDKSIPLYLNSFGKEFPGKLSDFQARGLYLKALRLENEQKFNDALKIFTFLEQRQQGSSYLYKKLALIFLKLGQTKESIAYLEKANANSDDNYKIDNASVDLLLGSLYEALEDHQNAIIRYEKILQHPIDLAEACIRYSELKYSDKVEQKILSLNKCHHRFKEEKSIISFQLGRAYLELNNLAKSEELFRRSYREFPEESKTISAILVLLEETGKEKEMERFLKSHLSRFPEDYQALAKLSDFYIERNEYSQALVPMEKMSDLNPKDFNMRFKLAFLYRETNKYREGISTLEEILAHNQSLDKVYYFLSDFHSALKQTNIAVTYLAKISPESEFYADTTKRLANWKIAKFLKGDIPSEELEGFFAKKFSEVKSADPLYSELHLLRASVWHEKKNIELAIDSLEKLKTIDKLDISTAYFLASLYETKKSYSKSDSLILDLLKKNPDNANALNFIGYSLLERETQTDLSKAFSYLEKAYKLNPNDGHIIDSMGWYYYLTNDVTKSLEILKKAYAKLPNDFTVNKHLALVYKKIGQNTLAAKYFQAAQKLASSSEQREDINRFVASFEDSSERFPASTGPE